MNNTRRHRNIFQLAGASIRIIKNEGFGSFLIVFKRWIFEKTTWIKNYMMAAYYRRIGGHRCFKDILFINGCTLNHPYRYRVEHQIEQLEFNGLTCDHIWYEDVSFELIKHYHAVIIFRCPITPLLKQFIARAKYHNKRVFFDIDDLIIEEKYIKTIKYLESLSQYEFDLYMEGVNRNRETLLLCDDIITTTTAMEREIQSYGKEVFVNRNVASETMVLLSHKAMNARKVRKEGDNRVYLGYLSGSITHNPDFEMIVPVLVRILRENPQVRLVIAGLINVPEGLLSYQHQLVIRHFTNWKKLPELIASIDINLAPLEQSIFNDAKSENKWTEAALVKVLTVAGRTGAFADVIEDGLTGLLCSGEDEWYEKLTKAINDRGYRHTIAQKAYDKAMKGHITAYTGKPLANFIKSKLAPSIGMVLPGTRVSGGINVLMKHYRILRDHGYDVTILEDLGNGRNININGNEINVISTRKADVEAYFDKLVASLWSTRTFVDSYPKVAKRYYLVQNFETDFYYYGNIGRRYANLTYGDFHPDINYITISSWCKEWLKEKFGKESHYAPNGIDTALFKYVDRDFEGKIRILIEGDSESYYKNVDESFRIAAALDRDRYEIWYLSTVGKPKSWYRVDRFFNNVPYTEVPAIYQQCHILVKSSILESFSYPPLEMMATGGIAVVAPNGGNLEYLKDGENCLLYELGNIDQALEKIRWLMDDKRLRDRLIEGGVKTAQSRGWDNITGDILKLYE